MLLPPLLFCCSYQSPPYHSASAACLHLWGQDSTVGPMVLRTSMAQRHLETPHNVATCLCGMLGLLSSQVACGRKLPSGLWPCIIWCGALEAPRCGGGRLMACSALQYLVVWKRVLVPIHFQSLLPGLFILFPVILIQRPRSKDCFAEVSISWHTP